jgi:predicted GNAT superfamily acetyltransferase
LKEFQREKVLEAGVAEMMWTYDPLESRNAHFNLERLGVCVHSYQRDVYGSGENIPLFTGIGTDRLVVSWDLHKYPQLRIDRQDRLRKIAFGSTSPDALALADDLATLHHQRDPVTVRIPDNIQEIKQSDPAAASTCRSKTREVFEFLLGRGFSFDGFVHDPVAHRGVYVLSPAPRSPKIKFPHSS